MTDIPSQNPVAGIPTEEQINALVAKHRAEIDRILWRGPERQQEEVQRYGLSPAAIEAHYPELQERAAQLKKLTEKSDKNATIAGWVTSLASMGGMFATGKKFHPSLALRSIIISAFSVVFGFLGAATWSKVFGSQVRAQNKQLMIDARTALERELAIAIERTLQAGVVPAEPGKASDGKDIAVGGSTLKPRDPSFAATALQEKAAAQELSTHR
jgi:hypothetical protein